STSVPGMPAKPTLDILVVLPVAREVLERAEELAAIGYDHQPDSFADDPDHLFFRKVVDGRRKAHLHALSSTSPKPAEYRLFRQFLIAHSEAASKYATDKLRLAERLGYDRSAYIAAKEWVVEELMKDARSWLDARDSGLPPDRS
ncbi:MAG: GrpB family protein, partial [Actinomycetota bacterium]|nr:GrpB family protein [Actinomycetota bacterium]